MCIRNIIITGLIVFSTCSLFSCLDHAFSSPTPTVYIINGSLDQYPAFSHDGNYIAYSHQGDTTKKYPPGLYVVDRNGNNRKLILLGVHIDPDWSPDGNWLVFSTRGILQKCKINGDSLSSFIRFNDQLKYPSFYFPNWSIDGKYIYFDNPFISDGGGIFKSNYDFSNPKRLFTTTQFGRAPKLSPVNDKIVFFDWISGQHPAEIFVIDTLGNNKTRLTQNAQQDQSPCWSPNGKKIAWSKEVIICVMNADGSSQQEITYGNDPSWSINNEIVFSHANNNYTKEVLYTISPDGKNRKQITF